MYLQTECYKIQSVYVYLDIMILDQLNVKHAINNVIHVLVAQKIAKHAIHHNIENKLGMNVNVEMDISIMVKLFVKYVINNAKPVWNLLINAPHVI